jgi:hypothetical protein
LREKGRKRLVWRRHHSITKFVTACLRAGLVVPSCSSALRIE